MVIAPAPFPLKDTDWPFYIATSWKQFRAVKIQTQQSDCLARLTLTLWVFLCYKFFKLLTGDVSLEWSGAWCVLCYCYFDIHQEEQAEENCCNLKDLREGQIGKMLVRKSGRVQLILGQVTLDVSLGTSCSFFQVCLQCLSPCLCLDVNISNVSLFSSAPLNSPGAGFCWHRRKNRRLVRPGNCQTQNGLFPRLWGSAGEQHLMLVNTVEMFSACISFPCPSNQTPNARTTTVQCAFVFWSCCKDLFKKKKKEKETTHIDKNLFSYCSIGLLVQGWGVPKFITVKIT